MCGHLCRYYKLLYILSKDPVTTHTAYHSPFRESFLKQTVNLLVTVMSHDIYIFKLSNQGNSYVKCKAAECFQNLKKNGLFSKTTLMLALWLHPTLFVHVCGGWSLTQSCCYLWSSCWDVNLLRISETIKRHKFDVMSLIKPFLLNRLNYVNKDENKTPIILKPIHERFRYLVWDLWRMRLKDNILDS